MSQPPVIRAAWVNRSVEEAFAVFTNEIGAWWPLPTHGLFGSESGSVLFREGELVEQATDGREIVWGEVHAWDPPSRLVVGWHPGRESSEASEVEVRFESEGQGTRVSIEHRGWEVFGSDAVSRRLGYVGPNAWGYVLDHFADSAEVRPDAVDVTDLRAGYETFFAEASVGGFGPAPEGEWNAEQVVAHVALNDVAMLGVCQALIHQKPARFDNEVCQDLKVLESYIEAHGSLEGIIANGREMARLVLTSLVRLSPEQLGTLVECRLLHDGEVALEQPLPWQAVALVTQATRHLPAHVEQLQNLRA